MDKREIIAALIRLPRDFNHRGDKSIFALLKETQYCDAQTFITELDLQDALEQNKECVEEWMAYSNDKRSSGWYIRKNSDSEFEVGYYHPTKSFTERLVFKNSLEACAAFIKREADAIGST